MTENNLTPLEFAKLYAEKSKIDLEFLAEKGFVVVSCDCEHPTCRGWGMESENYIRNCVVGAIPLPDEIYPLKDLLSSGNDND